MESLNENDSENASAADSTNRMEASDSSVESTEQSKEELNEKESASCTNIKTVHAKCRSQTDDKVYWLA